MPHLIKTSRLTLRPLSQADFKFIRELHLDEEILRNSVGKARTEEQSLRGFTRCLEIEREDPRLGSWIMQLEPDMVSIGNLVLRHPATVEKIEGLELGYALLPAFWGLGIAQEATRAMIDYAYREFGPIRLMALVPPENSRSRNVLLKTGFKSIGMTGYLDPSTGAILESEHFEKLA